MTGQGLQHSPILSALFGMSEDPELLGAARFIKGISKMWAMVEFKVNKVNTLAQKKSLTK